MSDLTYTKKLIAIFNSYDHMFKHMGNHELYTEWIFNQFDSTALISTIDNLLLTTWWCEQEQLETDGNGVPLWSPDLEGKSIRVEVLINETYIESYLDCINEISTTLDAAPVNIEVVDYTA